MRMRFLGIGFLVSSFAIPALAADRAIENGIDVWQTRGDGSTFVDFAKNPIPAGFFCSLSKPFTGKVVFRGEPIVTGTPGALGATDTIIQRLDDAVFNKKGVAVTRMQARALSLKSVAPIETACGKFDVAATLDGVQPITRMRITRENEKGGRFSAPLWLNVKVSFTPVDRVSREVFEIPMPIRFPARPLPWRTVSAPMPAGIVLVDTDGDRSPDTYLPSTSNFIAGHLRNRPALRRTPGLAAEALTEDRGYQVCHDYGTDKQHCTWYCSLCAIE